MATASVPHTPLCRAEPFLTGGTASAVQLHQLLLVSKGIWIFTLGLRYHLVKHTKKLWLEKALPKIKGCLHPPVTQTLSAESHSLVNPDPGWSRVAVSAV